MNNNYNTSTMPQANFTAVAFNAQDVLFLSTKEGTDVYASALFKKQLRIKRYNSGWFFEKCTTALYRVFTKKSTDEL